MRSGIPSAASRKSSAALQGERTPLPPGTQVGNYTITKKIGIGGFGIVYEATHTQDGSPVAIKEHMPEGLATRDTDGIYVHSAPETESRFKATVGEFLEEVTVLMGISHPGIVPILTAFEANGTAYYVMPFQKGSPMSIVEQGTLDAGQQAQEARHNKRLLLSLLSTMDYLRMHQIVHRDIKPDNILITDEGNTILLDFGSARQLQPGKVFTNVFTPDFSAPEQSHAESDAEMSESLGPWTDLYSLGVCFYYQITHLFPPRSELRMMSSVDPYTPLAGRADLEHLYGSSFLRAIDRALELKITDRWQSAAAWRIAIGEGIITTPQKKKRSIRLSTTCTIAALTLFAGISAWALHERSRALRALENSMNFNGRLLLDFNQEIADIPGSTRLQHILGEHLSAYLSAMEHSPGLNEEKYLRTLAASWSNYGSICAQRGHFVEADKAYQRATLLLKELEKIAPDSVIHPYNLAIVRLGQIEVARRRHHEKQIRQHLADAMAILDQLCKKKPNNPDFLCAFGQALNEEAELAHSSGDIASCRKTLKHMQNLYKGLLTDFPDHIKAKEGLGSALQYDGRRAMELGLFTEAAPLLEESCKVFTELSSQHPYHLSFKKDLALTYYDIGKLYYKQTSGTTDEKQRSQYDELALEAFSKHNSIVSYLEPQEENKELYTYMLCRSLSYMADILLRNGRPNLAEAHCKRISRKTDKLLRIDPDNEDYALLAAGAWRGIAKAHSSSPYYANEATEEFRQYRDIVEKLLKQMPTDASIRFLYTDALLESANHAILNGKQETARGWLKEAESILINLLQTDPSHESYAARLEKIQNQLKALPQTTAPLPPQPEGVEL